MQFLKILLKVPWDFFANSLYTDFLWNKIVLNESYELCHENVSYIERSGWNMPLWNARFVDQGSVKQHYKTRVTTTRELGRVRAMLSLDLQQTLVSKTRAAVSFSWCWPSAVWAIQLQFTFASALPQPASTPLSASLSLIRDRHIQRSLTASIYSLTSTSTW